MPNRIVNLAFVNTPTKILPEQNFFVYQDPITLKISGVDPALNGRETNIFLYSKQEDLLISQSTQNISITPGGLATIELTSAFFGTVGIENGKLYFLRLDIPSAFVIGIYPFWCQLGPAVNSGGITPPESILWGGITGTLADQTDLQNALNTKLNTSDLLTRVLTGLSTASSAAITAADTIIEAFGKLQAQLTNKLTKTGDTLQGLFTNSAPLTQIVLTGNATGDSSQGEPLTNSSPRIELATHQVSEYRSLEPGNGGYSEVLVLKNLNDRSKATIAWRDKDNKSKAWIVQHFQPQDLRRYANLLAFPEVGVDDGLRAYFAEDTGLYYTWNGSGYVPLLPTNSQYYFRAIHQHISIETTDTTTTALYTRLAIPYDLDVTPITTSNAHFRVTGGSPNGKQAGALIVDEGKVFSINPITLYPNSQNAGSVETWKDSANNNIFTNNTQGLRVRLLPAGNADNPASGQSVIALNGEGVNFLVFNENVVLGGSSTYSLGINRTPDANLDVQNTGLGVANNTEYTLGRFSRTDAEGFLNVGYIGNGSGLGSFLIRATGSKDIVLGVTGADRALRISAGTGNVTATGSIAATGTVTGSNLSGTNTGDQTTITGNAGSATVLQNARTINGVSFNGSANITVEDSTKVIKTGDTMSGKLTVRNEVEINDSTITGDENGIIQKIDNVGGKGVFRWLFNNTSSFPVIMSAFRNVANALDYIQFNGRVKIENAVDADDAVSLGQATISAYFPNNSLVVGESNIPRILSNSSTVNFASGELALTYFTAEKTENITQVRIITGATAAAGITLARIGVYSVATNGDLTLVASIANDTTLANGTFNRFTRTLTSTFNKIRGQRYAIGILFVGTTRPVLNGTFPVSGVEALEGVRLLAQLVSQADLPSSVSNASLTSRVGGAAYTAMIP